MLTSKQRAKLRAMANTLDPITQIGKGGITDAVVNQINETLEKRELIKIKVLETAFLTAREACDEICQATSAEPVQCIGTKFVIYRESSEDPQIDISEKPKKKK